MKALLAYLLTAWVLIGMSANGSLMRLIIGLPVALLTGGLIGVAKGGRPR